MTPRTFAKGLMISGIVLFVGTAMANFLIDPSGVFGTGLFSRTSTNYRYDVFRTYQRDKTRVDAILFASSRGFAIDPDLLTARLGAGKLQNQTVLLGLMTDHLPFLAYILRDKSGRGEKIKKAVLLVDADLIGRRPCTNIDLNCLLPPEVAGASAARFWWRYLTAVQFGNWRSALSRGVARKPEPAKPLELSEDNRAAPPSPQQDVAAARGDLGKFSGDADNNQPDRIFRSRWTTRRPELDSQFAMIEAFVRLCQEYGVELTVATTPLSRTNINNFVPGELEAIRDRLNRITDVWDFAEPGPMTDRPDVWIDLGHYKQEVGALMVTRMFGNGDQVPPGFGLFRPKIIQ